MVKRPGVETGARCNAITRMPVPVLMLAYKPLSGYVYYADWTMPRHVSHLIGQAKYTYTHLIGGNRRKAITSGKNENEMLHIHVYPRII